MATLGGSVTVYNPGLLHQLGTLQGVQFKSQYGGDNLDNTITLGAFTNGGITVLMIHASYEAAADTGNLNMTGAVASIRDQSPIVAVAAGVNKIFQLSPDLLHFKNADGQVSVVLKAGGTLQGYLAVYFINEGT